MELVEIDEQALVEKLVAHATVEGYDVTVLHWLSGSDVVRFHPKILCPAQYRVQRH
jgi:hypothetical protein